jgi:hypothetical protein
MANVMMENMLVDFDEFVSATGKDHLLPSDIRSLSEMGIDSDKVAALLVDRYNGNNEFFNSLKPYGAALTQSQVSTVLNDYLDNNRERLGLKSIARLGNHGDPVSTGAGHKCYTCGEPFPTWDALFDHKAEAHGGKKREPIVTEQATKGIAVIENTTATMGLDLSNLPDGRYAVPNMSGEKKDANVFIMVKRVRRTFSRDRRYVYGKIITGNELVLAGTIEVKLWSSDSKELVGEQKPDDVYRGKLEKELELLMHSPESFAKLFGRLKEKCCICGKALTDDISKAIGMGLECEKKVHYFSTTPPSLRPECPKCNEYGITRYGVLDSFNYSGGSTKYHCADGHRWLVDKKLVAIPLNF